MELGSLEGPSPESSVPKRTFAAKEVYVSEGTFVPKSERSRKELKELFF